MHFSRSANPLLLLLASVAGLASAEESTTTTTTVSHPECTTLSHSNGAFYDLRPDMASREEDGGRSSKNGATSDYHARGYDYGRNFTLNICAPVVDPVEDVVGLGYDDWKNVSAYYTWEGETYSIGQQSLDLKSHGRMLVLQYAGGSPCGGSASSTKKRQARDTLSAPLPHESQAYRAYDTYLDEDAEKKAYLEEAARYEYDDDEEGGGDVVDDNRRRKSTTISFHCDPEQLGGQVGVSFVGADPDDCAYFFEVRSQHACARAEPHQPGSVGPGSVFAIILVIAVLVYFGGGVFYQRTVAHARGWRQLPNYTLWAGIWNFICDMFVILVSSCTRRFPGRRGYRQVSSTPSWGRDRDRDRESENRLIDQLDEEWDD